jgi:manganese efflux pump family protein
MSAVRQNVMATRVPEHRDPGNRFSSARWDDRCVLKLLAFVLPLGLDSFAMAAALGARRPSWAQRWRLSVLFVLFEAGMPLIGLALGAPVARLVGPAAEYVAAAALVAVGVWMLVADEDDEEEKAGRLVSAGGWAAFAIGLSISVDELAIGFTIGLAGLSVVAVIIAIAVQALIASQLGLAVGSRVGEVWRERAERLAGLLLIALGVGLAVARLIADR